MRKEQKLNGFIVKEIEIEAVQRIFCSIIRQFMYVFIRHPLTYTYTSIHDCSFLDNLVEASF